MALNKIFLTLISTADMYASNDYAKKLRSSSNIEIILTKEANGAIDRAIVEAQGDWIAVIDSLLGEAELQKIVSTAKSMPSALAIVGVIQSRAEKTIGVRNISKTLPIIFDSDYLRTVLPITNIGGELWKEKIFRILGMLDRKGGLLLDPSYLGNSTYFNKYKILIRPYASIVKSKLQKNKITEENYDNSFVLGKRATPITLKQDIPVFINCRDRLEPLIKLIDWLEDEGLKDIYLIDNKSSYKPLLNFYSVTKHKVIRLSKNYGHRAPWRSGAISVYAQSKPYIVTDPDIVPLKGSHGALKEFIRLLNKYPDYYKVGFGLKIDNLPAVYKAREAVIKWESQFWNDELEKNVYIADVDTTFALYRAKSVYAVRPALRTGGKYMAEHEPWYQNSNKPSSEYQYYLKHSRREIATWGLDKKDSSKVYN